MKETRYYLAALAAFTTWGFFSLVLRPLRSYASIDILFYRVFSCAVLMLLIVLLFMRKQLKQNYDLFTALSKERKKNIVLINISGSIFLCINWFSFIYVMNHISVKATSLAYLVCPVLTALLAFFTLKEKLSRLQWISLALSISGCILLSYEDLTNMFFSMIIGLSYACYLVSQRRNTGFDKFIVLTLHIVFSSLILLPFYPSFAGPLPVAGDFYFYIEIIAVVYTIMPLFLNLYALKGINSSTVGMLLNINPMIAFVLAIVVYHEDMSALQISAYSIIFTSVIIFNARQIFGVNKKKISIA
ncbi:EamA family transporter [Dyadobacter sp. UP-52]|uniref:EamA family transporter n=1 Tax=Dyadobacter subterraneus TaxID=2773304 RepID=A0ABR9WDJ9_9BACT|nr:EamA family transporter [Dyadobacter subterraneus]